MLFNMALVWLMIYFSICSMTIVLKWYFEITFIPSKKDCADRPFEITYFSISGQHNLLKDFLWFPFRNDIWLSFRNEQCVPIFILKCFMTVISKWGGKIFVHKIILVRKTLNILMTKIPLFYIFRTQLFAQCLCPYTCVEIYFKKGDGLLCQILIILQC